MPSDNKPAAAQEAVWELAKKVRTELDRASCPDAFMRLAVEAVMEHAAAPVAAAPVVTADEREWLQYAIDHMRDDSEPEDVTCANVLEAMLERVDSDDRNPIADLVSGMSVSVDVDRLFDTDGRRLFGTVTEAMWDRDDKHGLTLLVNDAEPNWDASTPAAPGIDLRVRELLARRLRQWRTHLPADPAKPGIRAIRTYDHPGLEGETDYNNDVAIWREACSVLDEALTLIDASPKGGESMHNWSLRMAKLEEGQHIGAGAHGLQDSPKGGSDAVDAELWRFCNGKHQIDDAERIECHVIVGVNVWRGDEWLSFHQGSPEEVRAALQATSAEVGA